MTLRVCAEPGCPELTTNTRCTTHHKATRQASDRRRPNATQRGYDTTWRRTRGRYLKHHPTCEQPDCTTPSLEVHHLDGQGPNSPAGHKWTNLQALCKHHHAQITATLQPGGWNAR